MTRFPVPALLFAALLAASPLSAQSPASSPRELYDALNKVLVDTATVYAVERLELRRGDMRLAFEEGTLALLTPVEGRITGAVFSGRGHALAAPRDSVEKQQLARFTGAPLLDQEFRTAYLRFNDDTAQELLEQIAQAKLSPREDFEFTARWNLLVVPANPPHSLRLLLDLVSENPQPYFYAALDGLTTGLFEFTLDPRRDEPFSLWQIGKSGGASFYDLWASYRPAGPPPQEPAHSALRYSIETTVLPDRSLEGRTRIELRANRSGEGMLVFELSRELAVTSVQDDSGQELPFFQNEGLNKRERSRRGNDALCVILSRAPRRGDSFSLRLSYRGRVIEDAGNGVVFVGSRGNWYPHLGAPDSFADYEISLRWPRNLRLAATGTKIEEHEDGEFRAGRWRTDKPIAVAGFNLGEYESASVKEPGYRIDVFASRNLEESLRSRLATRSAAPPDTLPGGTPFPRRQIEPFILPDPSPSPADALRQLAKEIASSIHFYETYSGKFPYRELNVSQIPGTFGQGWPGLLYVSTFSFLPEEAQQRAGLSTQGQEFFSELVPFHEVAHQWWGNSVGWKSYRDQWITESISTYLSLLFADSRKKPDRTLNDWLTRYRKQLTTKLPGEETAPADIGPLVLGNRLNNSKSPDGYEPVIYGKGAWVIHMLRMLLRQPGARDPDARFIALLNTLSRKYANRALSTEDFQREVEAVMTPAMRLEGPHSLEWFFEDWVRGVGIPRYSVDFTAKKNEAGGYQLRGILKQSGVPRGFAYPVPLFAQTAAGKTLPLGTVIAAGEETPFRFTTPTAPRKILIDPQTTLLCVTQ
jgi:hypothetical protein